MAYNYMELFKNLAPTAISAYSAYNDYKTSNAANKLATQNYNYNKSLNNGRLGRQDQAQSNIDNAFTNVFTNPKKKKKLGSTQNIGV